MNEATSEPAAVEDEMRDHIVIGIDRDKFGPFWSTLGQNLYPIALESARKSRDWYLGEHPDWDVRIFRIEEVK
jgi:hypothetical protein